MKSILTTYDMYGNPIHSSAAQDANMIAAGNRSGTANQAVPQPQNENNFNDHMNQLHFRSNMHDMRDLMKSLNQETGSLMASRSNFNLNRSILFGNESNFYNQFGSSSNFKHAVGGNNGPHHPGSSMLAFSQG